MSKITLVSFEDQLKANPDLGKEPFTELKQWNQQQTHLPKLEDAELALFYTKNSYHLEATKRNINNYFWMRHHMRDYFVTEKDLKSTDLKIIFNSVLIVTLPQRTKENYRILLARLMSKDPAKYHFDTAVKVINMILDAGIYEGGPDNKYIFVYDLNGATMEHSKSLNLMGLGKLYEYLRRGSLVRWRGTHYTNTASGKTELQKFVKSKIVEGTFADNSLVEYHHDIETLMKVTGMERAMLPKEMGGEAGTMVELQKQQIAKLVTFYKFFVGLDNRVKLANPHSIPTPLEVFGAGKA